ncbi:hypothetical protein BDZ89DRAFT_1087851 [Hymenopellis radicata]|nr:hypothetical protein BDZ89DRAFT_1087851 [Hymenopellis radicata]
MAANFTKVLSCDPSAISFPLASDEPIITCPDTLHSLHQAANQLCDLQPVAFPTETPSDEHVSSLNMLHSVFPSTFILPRTYEVLLQHFWAGSSTLLFPTLIAITKAPLAAPSANSSGKPSPTRAEHVFRGKLGIILDGGACNVGLENTVVDGLQPDGGVTVEDINDVPKVLSTHHTRYPAVPVTLLLTVSSPSIGTDTLHIASYLQSLTQRRVFASQTGVDLILIEEIDESKEGLAVMNRVRKPASEQIYIRC